MNIQQEQLLMEKNAVLEKEIAVKNRELEIEAALERVRAKTNAMHTSKDLLDVITVLVDQFQLLGFKIHSANFNTSYREKDWNLWLYNPGTPMYPDQIHIPYLDNPFFNRTLESIANGFDFTSFVFTKEEKDGFLDHLYANTIARNAPEERKKFSYSAPGFAWSTAYLKNTALTIANYDAEPYTEEQNGILRRFGNVFEQSYTRFLDLQKAESQASEAQIELGLERVRARAMAMHKSENLNEVTEVVFNELEKLELGILRCGIGIINKEERSADTWITSVSDEGKTVQVSGTESMDLHPLLQGVYDAWLTNSDFSYVLEGEDLVQYYKTSGTGKVRLPDSQLILSVDEITTQYYQVAVFEAGGLFAFSANAFSKDAKKVMKRFAAVFNQSYTRFLDLQKAEAQAREAQIEAALEKIRSYSLAMRNGDELIEVVKVLFEKMKELDLPITAASIDTYSEDSKDANIFVYGEADGSRGISNYIMPYFDNIIADDLYNARQLDFFVGHYSKAETNNFYEYILRNTALRNVPDEIKHFILKSEHYVISVASMQHSRIVVNDFEGNTLSEEQINIIKRFATVFEQAYIRFLDLQKAEAQAREAQIEAALERVRGKAMAMHSSKDLADTIGIFYHEMELLSITPRRCGVGLMDKETHAVELSTMNTTEQGDSIEIIGKLKLTGHPVLEGIYDNWILQKEYHPVLHGNEIKEYYKLIRPQIAYPDYPTDSSQYGYFFFFNEGGVYSWTEKELSEDELKIYRRFTSVLSLTYKRYKDLQTAETNAKEAIKQAALDRIRADIAAMRTVSDLDRITPLIWNELTILGVPFIRCGVFIMDEEDELIHTFLSTPDGKAIAAFQIPYDTPGNIGQVLIHWQQKKIYTDHWDEAAFTEFAHSLVKQKALASSEEYLKTLPNGGFYLHFLPFLQGMLYVGNTTQLNEDEINLIQSVADAFSTAYARYEDFNKLENAKQKIEITLAELKSAQKQLIQSEKMASLGELTAGIAHEIQNPLNFVNNFSEVNDELISELVEEVDKKNYDEVKLLASDIKENSEKINHHGKRAGAIVTGMLQHSRTSTGQKELTDINALADEYLRLSYHGLRAKDKSFNATMKTDFDNSIEKINVVPQDIGRVFLNLINNAFYAVSEKRKAESGKQKEQELTTFEKLSTLYEPTVSVSTKKIGNNIFISVKDNGNGIPQNIVDKIFQPFFTTKPTGEGTGLGLSLSYDIIKAHGGELKVETKESEGSTFIIELPNV